MLTLFKQLKVDVKISGDVKWSNALFTLEESCIVKSLLPNTTYRFRVSCINTIGVSSYSWASEEFTTLPAGAGTITIDHDQAEKLLTNQYNLEKRSQQLVLIRKLDNDLKADTKLSKASPADTFRIELNNPSDLYTLEKPVYTFGQLKLVNASDKTHQTRRLIKFDKRKNENEVKILRELREQDRLVELIEGFSFEEGGSKTFAFVYAYAVPCVEFITLKHKYSEELVVRVLRQLLDGVQWLHLHGFVHLNIQAMTIMNANFTQVNVKLGGLENARQMSELEEAGGACGTSVHGEIRQALEFAGKLSWPC